MAKDRMDAPKSEGVEIDSLPRALRDSIDLNNEYAGRETGRMRRFLGRDQYDQLTEQEKKDRSYNALMRLLLDPDYARAYFRAEDAITRAEDAIAKGRRELDEQAAQIAERIRAMKDAAAQLPDGTKVFRNANGRLITEEGRDVTDQKALISGLSDTTQRWEEFARARAREDEIEAQRREIDTFERETVAPLRERIDDPDNPGTKEELIAIPEEIERAVSPVLQKHYHGADAHSPKMPISSLNPAADQYGGAAKLNTPDLAASFKAASGDEAYAASATLLPTTTPKIT